MFLSREALLVINLLSIYKLRKEIGFSDLTDAALIEQTVEN